MMRILDPTLRAVAAPDGGAGHPAPRALAGATLGLLANGKTPRPWCFLEPPWPSTCARAHDVGELVRPDQGESERPRPGGGYRPACRAQCAVVVTAIGD